MPVEATAGVMEDMAVRVVDMGMPLEDMPPSVTLTVDTLGFVLTVHVLTSLRASRADPRALQVGLIIGMAAATGEAVTGEAVIGIPRMDILSLAITARAISIHITGLAITVTPVGTMVRTTATTLTATDIGRT